MPKRTPRTAERPRPAAENRREFLLYLEAVSIRDLKVLALERGVSASSVLAEAIEDWLSRRHKAPEKTGWKEKRQFLATLEVRLMKALKAAAVDHNVPASAAIQEAVTRYLDRAVARKGRGEESKR